MARWPPLATITFVDYFRGIILPFSNLPSAERPTQLRPSALHSGTPILRISSASVTTYHRPCISQLTCWNKQPTDKKAQGLAVVLDKVGFCPSLSYQKEFIKTK